MKVVCVFGTRPEIIKMAPILWEARKRSQIDLVTIHTGQHYDPSMSLNFIEEFGLEMPNYNLGVGSASPARQIAETIQKLEDVLVKERPNVVVVQGDTNTAPAASIVARSLGIPLCHVEAGLRSLNERSWEEVNRRIASACALYHFAPTELAKSMLLQEGIDGARVFVTGNTVVDVVARVLPTLRTPEFFDELPSRKSVLVTIHRTENTDSGENLLGILDAIESISATCNVIMPLHPRTRKRLGELGRLEPLCSMEGVRVTGPLDYLSFMCILASVDLVVTDSGGVQEEAAILGKPTVTTRLSTPRWETVLSGNNHLAKAEKESILRAFNRALEGQDRRDRTEASIFGEPGAGRRIVDILLDLGSSGKLEYPAPDFVGKTREEIIARLGRSS